MIQKQPKRIKAWAFFGLSPPVAAQQKHQIKVFGENRSGGFFVQGLFIGLVFISAPPKIDFIYWVKRGQGYESRSENGWDCPERKARSLKGLIDKN